MGTLSNREKQLVDDLIKGLAAKEIATKNFISVHTVNTHFKRIKQKLNAKNNVEVAIQYLKTLENPMLYLKEVALVTLFVFIQGVSIVQNSNNAIRRPANRVARVVRVSKNLV